MADDLNDNDVFGRAGVPDPYGQAAILLIESLIHGLVERSVISVADAVEIIRTAIEVNREIGAELGETAGTSHKSASLLHAIDASLERDLPQD